MNQIVEAPAWHDYGVRFVDQNGNTQHANMQQPFFQTYAFNSCLLLKNGERVLVAGGMPSRDGRQLVYAFVTARLIGIDGKVVETERTHVGDADGCF